MAIIAQKSLFGWNEFFFLGDLERLELVLKFLPDEDLMEKLENERGIGRNDYPVRAMWNALIAGVVFQHPSIESLRRELLRNGQLLQLCGFDPLKEAKSVPKSWNFTRFLKKLFKHQNEFDIMFNRLVGNISEELPDFGVSQAVDGKAIASHANGNNSDSKKRDGRRDIDGDWAKKVYKGSRKDGSLWEKVVKWFGYRLHLIVDTKYELPIAYELTKASDSEVKVAHELIAKEDENHPELLTRCDDFAGDRGYDDGKLVEKLWDIVPHVPGRLRG